MEDRRIAERWTRLTQQYFELFNHDLGRPLRRILGKEREIRELLQDTDAAIPPSVRELLDEIEEQTPSFRLMMSNIQVLIELETPNTGATLHAVEPAEVVRRIVDRYSLVAADAQKQITWWSEPPSSASSIATVPPLSISLPTWWTTRCATPGAT